MRQSASLGMIAAIELVVGIAMGAASPARAATYFALASQGGAVNPGIYVGFNPQPDPPGTQTFITLDDASKPVISSYPPGPCTPSACGAGQTYGMVLSFLNIGGLTNITPPGPPENILSNADQLFHVSETTLSFTAAGHTFDVALDFAGPSGALNWGAFNPQPDPPGFGFSYQFNFAAPAAPADPQFAFSILEDGTPLEFQLATPLPAALPLFASGLGALGLFGWRRKRKAPEAIMPMKLKLAYALAGVAFTVTVLGNSANAASLLQNGSFESGDFTSWTPGGQQVFVGVASSGSAPDGSYYGYSGSPNSDFLLSQTFADTAGQTLTISGYFSEHADAGIDNDFGLKFNSTQLFKVVNSGGQGWTLYSFDVLATGSDTLTISAHDYYGFADFDNFSVTASTISTVSTTPLPATLSLFASGLGAFGLLGWRRKRNAAALAA